VTLGKRLDSISQPELKLSALILPVSNRAFKLGFTISQSNTSAAQDAGGHKCVAASRNQQDHGGMAFGDAGRRPAGISVLRTLFPAPSVDPGAPVALAFPDNASLR